MENKINIAELLKDCPKGMNLDCAIFENLEFDHVDNDSKYPIVCRIKLEGGHYNNQTFTKYGCYTNDKFSKCAIFPKGKTTWEGFVPQYEFKDGEIVATNGGKLIAIIKKNGNKYYCCCHTNGTYFGIDGSGWFDRLATEQEKAKLFQVMKDNGYEWNVETKTLKKLVEPIFKVGNKIEKCGYRFTIAEVKEDYYLTKCGNKIPIDSQDNFSLVTNEFDITTFKPFEPVLVRDNENCVWKADFYSHYEDKEQYPYICIGDVYNQCIPFNKETANLVNTTNACPDKYKTWKDE